MKILSLLGLSSQKRLFSSLPSFIQLSALASQLQLCSAKEALAFMHLGLLQVNGQLVKTDQDVLSDANITLLPRAQRIQENKISIAFYKPFHCASCLKQGASSHARQLLLNENRDTQCPSKVNPQKLNGLVIADRLPVEQAGLLLFTQDGRLSEKMENTKELQNSVKHTFQIFLESGFTVTEEQLKYMNMPMCTLNGEIYEIISVKNIANKEKEAPHLLLEIKGRLNENTIKNYIEMFGIRHTRVIRSSIGNISLDSLRPSTWTVIPRRTIDALLKS